MISRSSKTAFRAGLLLLGIVAGAGSWSAYQYTPVKNALSVLPFIHSNSPLAIACIPDSSANDIYFVNCGGTF